MPDIRKLMFCLLFFLPISVLGQNTDCAKYRNGQYYGKNKFFGNSVFVRKGDKQIEYNEKFKTELVFKIEWIDECSYTLQLESVLQNPNKEEFPMDDSKITIHLSNFRENSCTYSASQEGFDLEVTGEIEIQKVFETPKPTSF